MTVEELKSVIAEGENERVEMTRAFDKADKIGQVICASMITAIRCLQKR